MKRIPKATQQQIDIAVNDLTDRAKEVGDAIDAFNEALSEAREKLDAVVNNYNSSASALRQIYADLHGEAEAYYDIRSEKWQDSEAGQVYSDWMAQLEQVENDIEDIELDMPDIVEEPHSGLFDSEQWERPQDSPDET